MQTISVTEYATKRGISRQAVLKRLRAELALPGVIKSVKVGSTYILTVDEKEVKKAKGPTKRGEG